jgi:hypothetical protein
MKSIESQVTVNVQFASPVILLPYKKSEFRKPD